MDELMLRIGQLNDENMALMGMEPCEGCNNTGEIVSEDIYNEEGNLIIEGRVSPCPLCAIDKEEE